MRREPSRKTRRFVTAVALLATLSSATARAEIIDRILAVVNGALIMQSDVTMSVRLGLVPSAAGSDSLAAPLDALIERRLVLEEVDRYAPPDPADADVDRRLAEVRARAGTAFDAILRESGISVEQLRRQVRDDLRIDAYLLQRFGAMQPSDDEVQQYYRDHQSSFIRNGTLRPLDDVRDVVRAELMANQRATMIKDWIAGLRRRATINVLPR
jgi:peptidyl-prolyl cis-trans isomerase SurA